MMKISRVFVEKTDLKMYGDLKKSSIGKMLE
jgi:hypothetical protein